MSVVEVNFGKEKREAARQFARLAGLIEQQEAAILADPVHYMRRAGEKIGSLRRSIEEMREALYSTQFDPRYHIDYEPSLLHAPTTIMITLDEYKRWKKVEEILRLIQV